MITLSVFHCSRFGYCYNLVNVISLNLDQSDHIKRAYMDDVLIVLKRKFWKALERTQTFKRGFKTFFFILVISGKLLFLFFALF
jgi:hypothetical protein